MHSRDERVGLPSLAFFVQGTTAPVKSVVAEAMLSSNIHPPPFSDISQYTDMVPPD